jgi:DNA-binding response OmpR family regulator
MSHSVDILLVEDEPAIVDFMARTLRRAGYSVRTVTDGVTALAALGVDHPALLILDLVLPKLNGWAILDFMRAAQLAIPVVVVTANPRAAKHLSSYDIHHCLLKPFRLEDLLDAVGDSGAWLAHDRSAIA